VVRAAAADLPPVVIGPGDWSDFRDAFSDGGVGFGYTEWQQVRKIPVGVRIDHVLTGPGWRSYIPGRVAA